MNWTNVALPYPAMSQVPAMNHCLTISFLTIFNSVPLVFTPVAVSNGKPE